MMEINFYFMECFRYNFMLINGGGYVVYVFLFKLLDRDLFLCGCK